jgi:hypothetical protein
VQAGSSLSFPAPAIGLQVLYGFGDKDISVGWNTGFTKMSFRTLNRCSEFMQHLRRFQRKDLPLLLPFPASYPMEQTTRGQSARERSRLCRWLG